MPAPKPCLWNGIYYRSKRAAAAAAGVDHQTMRRWLAKGYLCDDDVPDFRRAKPNAHPIVWNGIRYESITQAAYTLGVSPATLRKWLKVWPRCPYCGNTNIYDYTLPIVHVEPPHIRYDDPDAWQTTRWCPLCLWSTGEEILHMLEDLDLYEPNAAWDTGAPLEE